MIITILILLSIFGGIIGIIYYAAQAGFSIIEALLDRPIQTIITILVGIGVIALCIWLLTQCFDSLTSLKYFQLI